MGFSGPAYALIAGEMLINENAHWTPFVPETCSGSTCQGFGGKLLLNFGNSDTPTLTLVHGTYTPAYTNLPGIGIWRAALKILSGTGRFANPSGLLFLNGPWAVWIDETGFHGRFQR